MNAPSLFDVAAEQEALATGKPLSQTRLEIEHGRTEAVAQCCTTCGAWFIAAPRLPATCNLCRRKDAT